MSGSWRRVAPGGRVKLVRSAPRFGANGLNAPSKWGRGGVQGATLVVARVGIEHEFETGRDKPGPGHA